MNTQHNNGLGNGLSGGLGIPSRSAGTVPEARLTLTDIIRAMGKEGPEEKRTRSALSRYLDEPETAPLVVGERPVSVGAQSLLSCLAFRQSTFVGEERGSIDRAARRRMERAGEPLPLVRIVNLRRKEREAQEHPHLSDSEYQYQWYVRPHVRQPNSRMKEQRPIWVNAYIKGPEGKPLKPPTMNVTVVKR